MIESVLYYLVQLKSYLLTGLAAGVILSLLAYFSMRNFSFRSRFLNLYGIFYECNGRRRAILVLGLNRVIYVIWLILSRTRIQPIHVGLFFLFLAAQILVCGRLWEMFSLIFHGLVTLIGIYVGSAVYAYSGQLKKPGFYLACYVLLGLFLILYSLVLFLLDIRRLTDPVAQLQDKNYQKRRRQIERGREKRRRKRGERTDEK